MSQSRSAPGQAVAAVGRRLRALIAGEQIVAGERLGDERSLAAALGISRAMLRAALEILERDGVVRRRIGRGGGVFLSDGRLERNLNTIESLPDITRAQGLSLETTVVRADLRLASGQDRRLLCLAEGAHVHAIVRLRVTAGRPLSVEYSRLPSALFPDLPRQDLTSLYGCLRRVYGVEPAISDETLEVVEAGDEHAQHLHVPVGSPLVQIRRVTLTADDRPIELGRELFVADRMRFHLRKTGYVRHTLLEQA